MNLWSAISFLVVILTAPIWVPLGIYIGLTYHWTDTVPKEDDYENG